MNGRFSRGGGGMMREVRGYWRSVLFLGSARTDCGAISQLTRRLAQLDGQR